MFQDEYKKAYDKIAPAPELTASLLERTASFQKRSQRDVLRHSFAAVLALVLCAAVVMPVCAAKVPAFYRVLDFISPKLADFFVPVEEKCTSQGITMEVEAVYLEKNQAQVVVSFYDEDGSAEDRVRGKMDLFDSYQLQSHLTYGNIGGCHFLEYDAETGKAYFKVDIQAEESFSRDKVTFSARELLCNLVKEERELDLTDVNDAPELKPVELRGMGGMDLDKLEDVVKSEIGADGHKRHFVLDSGNRQNCVEDEFTMTGAAYLDGYLRVQICMGDLENADRHVQPFLVDAEGNEQGNDFSVSWREEMDGASFTFYEYLFEVPFEALEDCRMYGIFHGSGDYVKGNWSVTFRVEEDDRS